MSFDSASSKRTVLGISKDKKARKNKLMPIFLALALVMGSVSNFTGSTTAFFTDTAVSQTSVMNSGILDMIVISPKPFNHPDGINPGERSVRQATVSNGGTMGFNYKVNVVVNSQSPSLCEVLKFYSAMDGIITSGPLVGFEAGPLVFTESTDNWLFKAELPPSTPKKYMGMTCEFDLVFSAWQESFSYGQGGFTDEEILASVVVAGIWTAPGTGPEKNTAEEPPVLSEKNLTEEDLVIEEQPLEENVIVEELEEKTMPQTEESDTEVSETEEQAKEQETLEDPETIMEEEGETDPVE